MKKLLGVLILLALLIPFSFQFSTAKADKDNLNPVHHAAKENPEQKVEPQQSKTGPKPPAEVLERDKMKTPDTLENIRSEVVLPVPAYSWRHGCGPTALGMVIGYYDNLGFSDLVIGNSFSQTADVDQMIASGGEQFSPNPPGSEEHYEDYASPQDYSPNMLDDAYITAGRIPHSDNSLADFMNTSKSTENNYYGWSWSSDVGPAFTGYTNLQNPDYQASYNSYYAYNGSLTWSVLTNEIDSGRPMVFLVDSDGNGGTDHFVTIIGYRTSPTLQYASWDTWSTTTVRWEDFEYIGYGIPWGIWGGWSLKLEGELNENILYVKQDSTGDCSNWLDACDLQTALNLAEIGEEIWVAAGTYKPTSNDDRSVSFQLKSGVALYGGFPAEGGDYESRDWEANITTLSGDIGDSVTMLDNSYHVIESVNVDSTAILDGFTVSKGNAIGEESSVLNGGGMLNNNSSPLIRNVVFTENWAAEYGGGIYNYLSNPTLMNVIFYDNGGYCQSGGGMYNYSSNPVIENTIFSDNIAEHSGGGMSNYSFSSPILENVSFFNNIADEYGGGGIYNDLSSPILKKVTFLGNSAPWGSGGAIYNSNSSPILTNITFSENSAVSGGGVYNSDSSPTLTNNTFFGNTADNDGGGIKNTAGSYPTIINTILWGNLPDQVVNDASSPFIVYSIIQDGYTGEGNLDENPLLGDLASNGGFTPTHALLEGSPAIDAGDPDTCPGTDQRGVPRPIDGDGDDLAVCDIGAYEYAPFPPFNYLPLILKK